MIRQNWQRPRYGELNVKRCCIVVIASQSQFKTKLPLETQVKYLDNPQEMRYNFRLISLIWPNCAVTTSFHVWLPPTLFFNLRSQQNKISNFKSKLVLNRKTIFKFDYYSAITRLQPRVPTVPFLYEAKCNYRVATHSQVDNDRNCRPSVGS